MVQFTSDKTGKCRLATTMQGMYGGTPVYQDTATQGGGVRQHLQYFVSLKIKLYKKFVYIPLLPYFRTVILKAAWDGLTRP